MVFVMNLMGDIGNSLFGVSFKGCSVFCCIDLLVVDDISVIM